MTKKSNVQRSAGRVLMLAVLLSTGGASAVADDYMPFVQEGKQWNYVDYINDDEVPFSYFIDGDTTICGKEYKKVYYQREADREYHCAVREEDRVVYVVRKSYTEERILCLFNLPGKGGYEFVQQNPGGSSKIYKVGRGYPVRATTGRIHQVFVANTIITDGVKYIFGSEDWIEGVGDASDRFFALGSHPFGDFVNCCVNGECIFTADDRFNFIEDYFDKQCATPTIAYDNGKLVFSCETEGAECVYEVKCADEGNGRGSEVSLSQTYEIRVHATLDGHYDSDVATATIGWRNGRPVMEGFSSVTLDGGDGSGDVNGDGVVDVADIATVIAVMAGQTSE